MRALGLSATLKKCVQGDLNPELLVEVNGELYPVRKCIGQGRHAIILLAEDAVGEMPKANPEAEVEVPVEEIKETVESTISANVAIEVTQEDNTEDVAKDIETKLPIEGTIYEDVPEPTEPIEAPEAPEDLNNTEVK